MWHNRFVTTLLGAKPLQIGTAISGVAEVDLEDRPGVNFLLNVAPQQIREHSFIPEEC